MNDLISREKFLSSIKKYAHTDDDIYLLNISDLERDINSGELAPDQMYKPGDMILVGTGVEREFIAMHKDGSGVWCVDESSRINAVFWLFHKPIPKTISVELPVDLVNKVKEFTQLDPQHYNNFVNDLLKAVADQVD